MSQTVTSIRPHDRDTATDKLILELIEQVANASELPTAPPWRGTTVLICAPGQDWSDSPNVSAYTSNGVTWVVTEYVEQLSWCFLQLQNILTPRIDYIGTLDVFSHLAEAAIDFLGRSSAGELDFNPEARGKALLLFVLQCARRLTNNPS